MMSKTARTLLVFLATFSAIVLSTNCFSAPVSTDPAVPTREQLQLQIAIMQDYVKKLEANLKSRPVNAEVERAYIETRKKEYEYLIAIMDVNIRAFQAQRFASSVILCLVVLVVVAGTGFAGFQLWKSVSIAGVQPSSELEVSASKVRVTSSVVGVVVLTISLVFLYIYTNEVYHIRVIGQTDVRAEPKPSDSSRTSGQMQ
jgi:hypothetical protein